ncbi:MAG: tetratricopeptide repeat protein [Deinococcus sp.]|nr:tetratricopeptide repeat protein [Deinococcus sp.]MCL5964907.1 tetratricopeptide repeat protein [Deinococcus sp.]
MNDAGTGIWMIVLRTLGCLWVILGTSLAAPASVFLPGARHEYQRFNNCGPVTIGMAMSYYGSPDSQYQIAPLLKPNKADKNVSPQELASFARRRGFQVHIGVAGEISLLKRLLEAGFPTIVESWFVVPDHGGMGHYRLLVGYDDGAGYFRAFDSYYGPKVTLSYSEFDSLWRGFNRTYLVVYPEKRAKDLEAVLGQRTSKDWERRLALEFARKETQDFPDNTFAWFNLGSSLLEAGDVAGAVKAFDRARATPASRYDPGRPRSTTTRWPWRMLWYQFGPYEAYYRAGRYSDVISLANENLRLAADLEESLYWRGKAYQALGKINSARSDYQQALSLRPSYQDARAALEGLGR